MKLILAALASCLLIGCTTVAVDPFTAAKARAISNMQNAPGMEYCEINHGVDPLQLEQCIRNAPDEASITRSCFGSQERAQVIEGCMIMSKTILQARQLQQRSVNCRSNIYTGTTCQSY